MKKKYVGLFLSLATSFIGINGVEAAKVSIIGSDNATVGEKITLNVRVSELDEESVIGIGGQIAYDEKYLELVAMEGMTNPYSVDYNIKNAKFAGIDFGGKGFNEDKNILKITFKVKQEGTTTVGFKENGLKNDKMDYEIELTNSKTDVIENTTIVSKNLVINKKLEEPKTIETVKPIVKEEISKKEETKVEVIKSKEETPLVKEDNKIIEVETKATQNQETVVVKNDTKKEETIVSKNKVENSVKEELTKKDEVKSNINADAAMACLTDFFDRFKTLFINEKSEVTVENTNNLFGFIGDRLIALLKRV